MDENLLLRLDAYIDGLFVDDDPALDPALADMKAGGLPDIQVSAGQGKLLYLLAKIAGAAQKRSKHGLLLQGSLWRPHVGPVDRLTWQDAFATRLAALLDREIRDTAFPAEWDEAVDALAENYAAPEWNERR